MTKFAVNLALILGVPCFGIRCLCSVVPCLAQVARDSEQAAKQKAAAREAALVECKTRLFLQDKDLLGKVVTDTVGNIEKKQARTYEELQAEQMEAEEVCTSPQ